MMNRLLIRTILLLGVLTGGVPSVVGQVQVKTAVNKTRILIGEPVELTVEVRIPHNERLQFPEPDSIPHFELLELPVMDTTAVEGGTLIRGTYRITSFDSGAWVIPAIAVPGSVATDSIAVDVGFSDADPGADYHGIKDVLDAAPVNNKNHRWWFAAGGLLLVLLLLIVLRKKKQPAPVIQPEQPAVPPYAEAVKALKLLEEMPLSTRQYHTELTRIFRVYVYRKKNILSLQKTTDDLVVQLKSLPLEQLLFNRLAGALRLSDQVKFARFEPETAENREVMAIIKETIEAIEKSD